MTLPRVNARTTPIKAVWPIGVVFLCLGLDPAQRVKYYRSMTWLDDFEADLLRMVQRDKPNAVKITDWEEGSETGGYCESCYYDDTVVEVTFQCNECGPKDHFIGYQAHSWVWRGGLASLMRELVRE